MSKIIPLPPFKAFLASNIPSVYDNTLSYYDELTKLIAYMEELVPAVNANTEGLAELKKYVENYFDNLDVQEEINNKLDDMAESGQLATIIAEFLAMAPVFGFTNIAAMAASENLNVGSIARVLGNTSAAAGDGAFYLVRSKGEGESADGVQKVAIGDSLIADRIINATANDLQDQIDELREPVKKYLFIGDSYADGYTPDGDVTPWQSIIKTKMNIADSQFVTTHQGGFGFGRPAEYNYYTLISALSNDNDMTDIVIGGGYNDQAASDIDITSGITNVYNLCKTKFPNAKLHIAFIGWSKNAAAKTALQNTIKAYKNGCDSHSDIDFMKNTQYALHDYFTMFSSDGVHPNLVGETAIANAIIDCLLHGSANIYYRKGYGLTPIEGAGLYGTWQTMSIVDNATTQISILNNQGTMHFSPAITLSGKTPVKIADINSGLVVGDNTYSCCSLMPAVVQTTDNVYHSLMLYVIISGGSMYIQSALINEAGSSYDSMDIKMIQFSSMNMTVPTIIA